MSGSSLNGVRGVMMAGPALIAITAAAPGATMLERYAVAACFASQRDAYLRDQGDAWAAALIQRGHGDPAALGLVAAAVRRELARGAPPIGRDEAHPMKGKPLVVMQCGEIADRSAVRAAIARALRR